MSSLIEEKNWQSGRPTRGFVSTINLLNVAFAGANIFLWSVMALYLADPISWATWTSLGSVAHRPDLLEYPYVMLWGLPLLGSGVGMLNNFLGFHRLANVAAAFPLALFAFTIMSWALFT